MFGAVMSLVEVACSRADGGGRLVLISPPTKLSEPWHPISLLGDGYQVDFLSRQVGPDEFLSA